MSSEKGETLIECAHHCTLPVHRSKCFLTLSKWITSGFSLIARSIVSMEKATLRGTSKFYSRSRVTCATNNFKVKKGTTRKSILFLFLSSESTSLCSVVLKAKNWKNVLPTTGIRYNSYISYFAWNVLLFIPAGWALEIRSIVSDGTDHAFMHPLYISLSILLWSWFWEADSRWLFCSYNFPHDHRFGFIPCSVLEYPHSVEKF